MTPLNDLDALFLEHRRCGVLESEVVEGEPFWVVMDCSCGARLARSITRRGDPPRHSA
jgi:hypothetical protein